MKLFVTLTLVATVLFGVATYRPTQVCSLASAKTTIVYNADGSGMATTDSPTYTCRPSHL